VAVLGAVLGCAAQPSEVPLRPTGLDRPFPAETGVESLAPAAARERVELGRLLFFDRILSGPRDLACADCHRPEAALSDGAPTSLGRRGPLARNAPTLYNVSFKRRLFWDRRSPSLEAQAFEPLFSPDEMAADPAELLARLGAIPEYAERFARSFPEATPGIDLDRVARALAAFERTLISRRSRFDRWAAGERQALSASELRGLRLFRSLRTRCFECHRPPTFDAPIAVGVGVPGDDPGVGGVTGIAAQRGLFGVPTLRNVGATGPYMHDGSIGTLEEVVDFYRRGGGRALGVDPDRVDGQIRAFQLDREEAGDLVAFLRALGDEAARPIRPESVPSGLPVPSVRSVRPEGQREELR
jgi:cytochrome c peroxidase